MPGANKDNLTNFREGDRLTASQLQQLVNALKQQVMAPGTFQTGAFSVQRPMGGFGGGSSSGTVAIRFARVLTGGITKASGNLIGESGSGYVHYLADEDGVEDDEAILVFNRMPVAYVADSMVALIGEGLILGMCSPPGSGFWDE